MNEEDKIFVGGISLVIDRFSKDLDESSKEALTYGRELLYDMVKTANDYSSIGKRSN